MSRLAFALAEVSRPTSTPRTFSAFQLGASLGAAGLAASLAATDGYSVGLWGLAAIQTLAIAAFARLAPYRHL